MNDIDQEKREVITDLLNASTVFPLNGNTDAKVEGDVKMRKHKLLSSKKTQVRPVVSPEEKECLATWVRIGELNAWALWDSGSTMTGITPSFAEIAKIPVDTLEDPHILQLGTTGSRSIIKYGADVTVKVAGVATTTYVDIANFDRYEMVIGTPFMRWNKVHLDFEHNIVIINGEKLPAVKVEAKDLDPRIRRYRTMDRKKAE